MSEKRWVDLQIAGDASDKRFGTAKSAKVNRDARHGHDSDEETELVRAQRFCQYGECQQLGRRTDAGSA